MSNKSSPLCYLCGIKMEKTIDNYEEGEVYKCPKCGEVLLDSEQIDSFQRKANIFKIKSPVNVIENSITMQIPKRIIISK